MKKIPYGIFNYQDLITSGYIYIDKTMYLEKLENTKKTLIYLRPGRFGKSLFTSMMYYYYDVKSEDKFDTLFKSTYVYEHPTPNKNNYYILKFDFSNITTANMTEEQLKKEFTQKVISGIENFELDYNVTTNIDFENLEPNNILLRFFLFFKSLNYKEKLYILIDEYDNFTNAILRGRADKFKSIVGNEGFVKTFYACIKEYIGLGLVDRFFATGICPITLNSMTTGFNIATDISLDREFNSMIGLTHDEVWNLLSDYDKNVQKKIFDIMLKNYDGYLFSKELPDGNRVFNATLVMYLLSEYERFQEIPDKLYDNNITVNYEKIENILKLQDNEFYVPVIDTLLKEESITCFLKDEFNAALDFTKEDVVSLLYYFGYLTIKGKDDLDTVFVIPNEIMKQTYNKLFVKILNDYKVDIDDERRKKAISDVAENLNINEITNYVSDLLRATDNRIFMKFDEKYIQLLYYTLLHKTLKFSTYVEYPANGGYVDVMLLGNKDLMNGNIMIEIKYIKKGEFKRKLFEELKTKGIEQLKNYSLDKRLDDNLKKYLVIFSGCDVKLIEEVN